MTAILDGRSITPRGSTLFDLLTTLYPHAVIAPRSTVAATADPMVARINHGIWIAACTCGAMPKDIRSGVPNAGCVVFLDDPWGWCVRCGNRAWGGGWRRIAIPDEPQRRLIEAVLLCRPNVGDRNWEPYETVETMMVDNVTHGDPVPDLASIRIGPMHGPQVTETLAPFPPPAVIQAATKPVGLRRRVSKFLLRGR